MSAIMYESVLCISKACFVTGINAAFVRIARARKLSYDNASCPGSFIV